MFLGLSVSALALLDSCQKKLEQPVLEIVGQTEVRLSSSAGEFDIVYRLDNPAAEGKIIAEIDSDWIVEKGCDGEMFSFEVSENTEADERNAVVTIKYTWPEGVSEKKVAVVQAGIEEIPADYEVTADYFYGEYYGDEDADGRYNYKACLSEAPIDEGPVKGNYYFLDIFGAEAVNPVNPCPEDGEYKVDAMGNDENKIVAKDNSYIVIVSEDGNSDKRKLDEGMLSVRSDGEKSVYDLTVTDRNGQIHKVTFSGVALYQNLEPKSEVIEDDMALTARFAKVDCPMGPIQGRMQLLLTFSDKEFGAEGSKSACSVMNVEAMLQYDRNGNIPEGTYRIEPTLDVNTLLEGHVNEKDPSRICTGTYAEVYDETGYRRYGLAVSGTMEVKGNKDNYEITCMFETPQGVKIECEYTGALEIQGLPDIISTLDGDYTLDLEGASAKAIFREGGNWDIILTSSDDMDGDNFEISLVAGGQKAEDGIENGTYHAAKSGVPQKGEYLPGYDSQGIVAGTFFYNGMDFNTMQYITVAPAVEGDFNITNLGGNEYSMSFEFKDDLGFTWSGVWSGQVNILDFSK